MRTASATIGRQPAIADHPVADHGPDAVNYGSWSFLASRAAVAVSPLRVIDANAVASSASMTSTNARRASIT
jgi:hypothetical protein